MTIIIDVDGVLTDGKVYYSETGDRQKSFHSRDIPAIKRLKAAGYNIVLLSKSKWKGLIHFAARCRVNFHSDVQDKAQWVLDNIDGDVISVIDSYDDIELANISKKVFIPFDSSFKLRWTLDDKFAVLNTLGGHGVMEDVENELLK